MLTEFEAHNKTTITVFNKIDKLKDSTLAKEVSEGVPNPIFISALKREGFGKLINKISTLVKELKPLTTSN
ncbi:hypothetical protein EOM09_06955 [bacterium]|nr:hypothetical protein [bacterium]